MTSIDEFKAGLMLALDPQGTHSYGARTIADVAYDMLVEAGFSIDVIEKRLQQFGAQVRPGTDAWVRLGNALGVLCITCGGQTLPDLLGLVVELHKAPE